MNNILSDITFDEIAAKSKTSNGIIGTREKPFIEYDEGCYKDEMEETLDMIIDLAMAYSDKKSNRFDEVSDKVIAEVYRLYEERAALMRIILAAHDKEFKDEYKRLIAERGK